MIERLEELCILHYRYDRETSRVVYTSLVDMIERLEELCILHYRYDRETSRVVYTSL